MKIVNYLDYTPNDFYKATRKYLKKYVNGSGSVTSINDIGDVNTSGAADGYVLTYTGGQWIATPQDSTGGVPAGGTAGQVLKKQSSTDYDFVWSTDEGEDTIYVNTYADLPDPTTVTGLYGVLTSTGTPYISVLLGGNYRAKGFYYSNGTQWIYLGEFPIQATDSEVAAGTVTDKFVAPSTLNNNYFKKNGNSFGSEVGIGTNDNYNLHLRTNNNIRLTVLANGNVGIGTGNSVFAKFQIGTVGGANGGDFYCFNSAADPRFLFGENSNQNFWGGLYWHRSTRALRIINSNFSASNGSITIDNVGSVAIGENAANTSSKFDVVSTTKGARPVPSMTGAQRVAITSPVQGLEAFQTDGDEGKYVKYNSDWRRLITNDIEMNRWRRSKGISYFNDFLVNTTFSDGYFLTNTANGGSVSRITQATYPAVNRQGITALRTQSTNNARAIIGADPSFGNGFIFGGGQIDFETDIVIPTLSNSTERYVFLFGYSIAFTNYEPARCIMFTYDEGGLGNGTTTSGNWFAVASAGAGKTTVDTSIPVVNTGWIRLRVSINAAATEATFYINNSLVATINTNIPTGTTQGANPILGLFKTTGTTDRRVEVDYVMLEQIFTTER